MPLSRSHKKSCRNLYSNSNSNEEAFNSTKKDKNKIYSLHEPDVHCISKGKAHKCYEFGCKVSITTTHKQGLVISSEALPGNPYGGYNLKPALESIGHMKQEGKLGLCRLKGIIGDQINAILTGVGHNLRLILNHIRKLLKLGKLGKFLAQILLRLLKIFCQKLIDLENVENGK